MKIVHKNQTNEFKNSDACIATEYALMDQDINVAYVEIKGRYPDKGRVTNEVCKEMAYITEGKGRIVVEDEEIELNAQDLILLEPGERYYWEGNLKMVVPCTPAWYPEQHKEVE